MAFDIQLASTEEDLEIVHRLCYDVYVDERRFDFSGVDHESRTLRAEADDVSDRFLARIEGEPAGTISVERGARSRYGAGDREIYQIERFAEHVRHEATCIISRLVVLEEHRSTALAFFLMQAAAECARDHAVELGFSFCEPHLINLYLSIGWRPYKDLVSLPETGLIVPLVFVTSDLDHLRRVGSPLLPLFEGQTPRPELAREISRIIGEHTPIHSPFLMQSAEEWSEAYDFLSARDARSEIFEGMSEEERSRLLDRSLVIECKKGHHLIRNDKTTHTLYVVLEGTLEVLQENRFVAVRGPGEVVGEIALLLNRPRTGEVVVASDEARVLALIDICVNNAIIGPWGEGHDATQRIRGSSGRTPTTGTGTGRSGLVAQRSRAPDGLPSKLRHAMARYARSGGGEGLRSRGVSRATLPTDVH